MKKGLSKLGEFFDIKHGYAFKGEYFSDEGSYVLMTPGNFYEEGGFKSRGDKEKYYIGDIPESYILNQDDLIVVMTEQMEGLLGSPAIVPANDKYLHNQRLGLIVDLDEENLCKKYLYYLFNTRLVRHQISASATGTKVRHTSPKRILSVEVNLPEIGIQRKIASILSAYDELIENNIRRIEILEQAAQELYKEWFVRLKFPGYEHTESIDGVPNEWSKTSLSELSTINQETLSSSYIGEIVYVDISSVSQHSIDETATYNFLDAPSRARRVTRHGDILWSCVRPNLRSHAIVWNPTDNMIASTGFAVISPSILPTSYIYYSVTTDSFVGYLTNRASGAAYPAVKASDFEIAEIIVPPMTIVNMFDEFVKPLIEQKQKLREQNKKLQQARDLLLPKLMTGEIVV